ncbi:hypothetical protein PRZ48_005262 [Zasmidium cellare]|uniref:Proline dehydrogenase n=1 Tax=Zasmidium cellare TaxID=395010 RepID=A0ABR0ERY4_ZASCE|nr:hypothetical protein PRZ48_005262 [Zasmidium cellare]
MPAMKPARAVRPENCIYSKHTSTTSRAQLLRPTGNQERRQHTQTQAHRRRLHSTAPKEDVALPLSSLSASSPPSPLPKMKPVAPLGNLPLSQILRTYLITSISSSPALMNASTKTLRAMLESSNPLFDLNKNPLMRWILLETFYKQFCAGSNKAQIAKTTEELRQQGYSGVILEYALEVLTEKKSDEAKDVETWKKGMLDSVDMAAVGDYVALKWSGMGPAAMRRMKNEQAPSREMEAAMHAICKAASAKNIGLLPSAEETWTLNGYHNWTMDLQRAYNIGGKSVMFNTYQAYLRQSAGTLAKHLEIAKAENFTLGVKMVRGAYLGSEQRDLIWPTIEATHNSFDTITSALIHRSSNDLVNPTIPSFPSIDVVLATHNAVSVSKAQTWRQAQSSRGEHLTPLIFAQLHGMADEVSCSLLANAKASEGDEKAVKERVFKYTSWGSMFECLNYLLRRAAENKDAAGRTSETRAAMGAELGRRLRAGVGLA